MIGARLRGMPMDCVRAILVVHDPSAHLRHAADGCKQALATCGHPLSVLRERLDPKCGWLSDGDLIKLAYQAKTEGGRSGVSQHWIQPTHSCGGLAAWPSLARPKALDRIALVRGFHYRTLRTLFSPTPARARAAPCRSIEV